MRKTMIASLVGFALLAVAATASAAPESNRMYFMKDYYTGDSGVSTCDQGRYGRYTTPMYYMDLYRGVYNAAVGTAGWGGYALYQCTRGGPKGQSDEYMSTDPNCTVAQPVCGYNYDCASWGYDNYGYYTCLYYDYVYSCYNNYYYGSRVDWSGPAGYTLYGAYEGSTNVALYLCSGTTYDAYGGYWTEFAVLPGACSAGWTQLMFLGYGRGQPYVGGEKDLSMGSAYDQCVEGSGCFGECGANCDGLAGTHIRTSECLAHDRCVCQHGGNAWAWECLGGFLAAGVSWVVSVFVSLVKTVIGFVVSVVKKILRALCFWC